MENKYEIFENDIDELMLNNINAIRDKILITSWNNAPKGSLVEYQDKILGKKILPRSAYQIVIAVDQLKTDMKQLNQFDPSIEMRTIQPDIAHLRYIRDTASLIEHILNSEAQNPAYESIALNFQTTSAVGFQLLTQLIENEIYSFEKSHVLLKKMDEAYLVTLKGFLKDIQFLLNTGEHSVEKLCELRQRIVDIHHNLTKTIQRTDFKDSEEEEFFKKRIENYSSYLINNQESVSEATRDLEIIVKAILSQINNPNVLGMFRINLLDEVEVTVGQETYNLTQILKHDPNFGQINLNEAELDSFLHFLQTNKDIIFPQCNFPVFIAQNDSKKIMHDLDAQLKAQNEENLFEACHAAECLAINIYTSEAYIIFSKLLRDKNISETIFAEGSKNPNDQAALDRIEKQLSNSVLARHAKLSGSQRIRLTLEAIIGITLTARGINKAKHLCYHPSDIPTINPNNVLNPSQGRSYRLASGDWTKKELQNFILAKKTGIPIYSPGFTSTSFNTQAIGAFLTDTNTALVTKTHPWSGLAEFSIGAIIKTLSKFPTEFEYLFPPCLCLVQEEKPIKHQSHYGTIQHNKKVTMVMVNGNSPQSLCYSTEMQKIRTDLIHKWEQLSELNFNNNPDLAKACKKTCKHIEKLVNKLDTQLKTVKVHTLPNVSMQELVQQFQQKGLRTFYGEQTNIVFLLSQATNTVIYIDKIKKIAKEIPLNSQQYDEMVSLLNLKMGYKKTLNHLEIAYMGKLEDDLSIDPINEPEFILKCYDQELTKIDNSFNHLNQFVPLAGNRAGFFGAQPQQNLNNKPPTPQNGPKI